MKRKPPQWQRFDRWVFFGALVGLGIAIGVFCTVHFVLYGNFAFIKNMRGMALVSDIKPSDILTMTATALGGFTIGGAAVMQYRKHKWAEYQAKMDEDSRTGERLSKAIEHLSEEQKLHTRLGAIYEFKNLAEDSPRNKENIVQILTAFLISYEVVEEQPLPQDIEALITSIRSYVPKKKQALRRDIEVAAARVLSPLVKDLIEETAKKANKNNRLQLPKDLFNAIEMLNKVSIADIFQWQGLKASWMIFDSVCLEGAHLEGANLKGALLRGSLMGAHLHKANLKGVDFRGTCFDGNTDFGSSFTKAIIDDKTYFNLGVRMKYFGEEEPEHPKDFSCRAE